MGFNTCQMLTKQEPYFINALTDAVASTDFILLYLHTQTLLGSFVIANPAYIFISDHIQRS